MSQSCSEVCLIISEFSFQNVVGCSDHQQLLLLMLVTTTTCFLSCSNRVASFSFYHFYSVVNYIDVINVQIKIKKR